MVLKATIPLQGQRVATLFTAVVQRVTINTLSLWQPKDSVLKVIVATTALRRQLCVLAVTTLMQAPLLASFARRATNAPSHMDL
jgi:hypothetical protein